MSSIKQLIVNAINKVSTDPKYAQKVYENPDEARDDFTRYVLAELFPEDYTSTVTIPVVEPAVEEKKEIVIEEKKEKKKAEKKEKKVEPVVEKKPEPVPEPVIAAALPASPPNKERKKRAPMSDEAKAAMKAKREATIAAKKSPTTSVAAVPADAADTAASPAPEPVVEKEKKPRKTKTAADANLPKIDPTWKKHLKKAAGDKYGKDLENYLLKFVNAMNNTAFNNIGAEEHIKTFMAQKDAPAPADDGKVDAELTIVEFNDKEYYVNPETKRVYEGEGEFDEDVGGWTNYKAVGYVGMAAFADMELE